MTPKKAREIAAGILKTGKNKVVFDENALSRIKEAMTKDDIRALINEKLVKKNKINLQSAGRTRTLKEKKKKGRKKGIGKRRGKAKARSKPKKTWQKAIRALRKTLRELKKKGEIKNYRQLYLQAKGGHLKTKKQLAMQAKRTR